MLGSSKSDMHQTFKCLYKHIHRVKDSEVLLKSDVLLMLDDLYYYVAKDRNISIRVPRALSSTVHVAMRPIGSKVQAVQRHAPSHLLQHEANHSKSRRRHTMSVQSGGSHRRHSRVESVTSERSSMYSSRYRGVHDEDLEDEINRNIDAMRGFGAAQSENDDSDLDVASILGDDREETVPGFGSVNNQSACATFELSEED